MSKGISLHIGLNVADPNHYKNIPTLQAAVNDAVFWEKFARQQGFTPLQPSLHDEAATVDAVKKAIQNAAENLGPGDIFLLTYSGHGGELTNEKQEGLDKESYDQTWCLYDKMMLDDEIHAAFEAFAEGVRITVVSDSCHSGTITMVAKTDLSDLLRQGLTDMATSAQGMRSRHLPKDVSNYVSNLFYEEVYKPIQDLFRFKRQGQEVKASVKLLAACQDNQETLDGKEFGLFTEALKKLLDDPKYKNANAEALIEGVRTLYFSPRPQFFEYGGIIPTYDTASPFQIVIPAAAEVVGTRPPNIPPPPPEPDFDFPPAGWLDAETGKTKAAVLRVEFQSDVDPDKIIGGKDIKVLETPTPDNPRTWQIELRDISLENAWSAAHALQITLQNNDLEAIVEPLLSASPAPAKMGTREADPDNPDYKKEWPPANETPKVGIGWHLDDAHSQLTKAQQAVRNKLVTLPLVRIAHLDTGYIEGHRALPENLNTANACSFVKGDAINEAIDKIGGQDGHGTGTLGLLAGGKVKKSDTFGEFEGYLGGVPFAEVIPMRISDSVAIWNSDNFCKAVQRAIHLKCEVITMSMAGKPNRQMADMVNKAYEAGIVIVSAASNCWYKGLAVAAPKCVLYPAAFQRVIAATGAMYNQMPYDVDFLDARSRKIDTKYMQGCWGPPSRMTKALAAYTPNTPWASHPIPILRSGGGTSSATPQIAAAAALWIAYHRAELEAKGYYDDNHRWKKVEAVRHALFTAARESAKKSGFAEWEKYYGNGILRAYDALQIGVADESMLQMAPEAESSLGGFWETATSFFLNRRLFRSKGPKASEEALSHELLHLLYTDPVLKGYLEALDLGSSEETTALLNDAAFRQKIAGSPYASGYLRERMA